MNVVSNDELKRLDVIVGELKGRMPGAIRGRDESFGDIVLIVDRSRIHDVLFFLRKNGFELLLDIAVVDGVDLGREERFEVIYNLYSVSKNLRIRLKVFVPEGDAVIPSAVDLWKAANWAEREAFDLFGIDFEGHPNLIRILTHHEFKGHALRKDYSILKGQWCSSTRDMREDLDRE
jgi:NADH/F420H2 dehydrogenase subunit C